ncbi:MAG: PorV/PorQ family protein [bacterium]|nr:PorV/PorQ family protein [bacterium]MDD5353729.1 PorV/PorQ family protein [bacterium]MDD5755891.1 PorV/PorQ family protein [bacterium]
MCCKAHSITGIMILLMLWPGLALGQAASGGQPGSFLHLGPSARALGMGNSFTAISDNAAAAYYNPAGLAQLLKYELNTFYAPLWEETNYNFIGFAYPLEKYGTIAASMITLTSVNFQRRETVDSEPINFSFSQKALLLSYATKLTSRLSVGTTLKSVTESADIYSASAFGIDAGVLYHFLGNKLTAAANFQNLMAPAPKLNTEKDKYPFYSKFGVAYRTDLPQTAWEDKLVLAADVDYSSFIQAKNHFGVEYWFGNNYAARIGKDINNNITCGLGITVAGFTLDYAAVPHALGFGNRISVTYRFGYIGEAQYSREAVKEKVAGLDQSGAELYNSQKYALALGEWDKALIWDPQNKEIQDKVNKVSAELDAIVNRKLIEQHVSKAYVLFADGKLVDSMEQWKEVAKLDPANERAKEYITKINEKLAKEDRAILNEREKENEIVRINNIIRAGDDLYDKERYNEALNEYQKVLRIKPEHLTANKKSTDTRLKIKGLIKDHYDNGELLYKNGDKANAVKEFRAALRLDPGNNAAARYLDKIKQEEQTQVTRKVDQKQINQLYYKAADLYLKGQYQETINRCNQILALDPTNENAEKLVSKAQSVLEAIGSK